MNSVLRAIAIYFFLLLMIRLTGKRNLAQITTFDFVLVLVIGQATQLGLIGLDYSLTNSFILIATLVGVHLLISRLTERFRPASRWVNGTPLLIVENGRILADRAEQVGVSEEDILAAARGTQGLERLDQVRYAVIERDGSISIIPKKEG